MPSVTGVPAGEVGNVVQDFINDGATEVIVEKMSDGTYSVSTRKTS
jgi:hypothetical protein